MVKGKSSASSNTRKKHAAKKSGNPDGTDATGQPAKGQQPKQRGQKESKLSKAQRKALPKIKQYIPPPKAPAPPIPDPLDSLGLGRTLPPELVVVLRRLGKKDEVTRRKGIEEFREGWVEPVLRDQTNEATDDADLVERELKEEALVGALPVWLHHLSTLLHSPSHRAPALAVYSLLLSIPSCLSSILNTLSLGLLPGTQHRDLIGSWLVSSLEEGRRPGPGGAGLRKWDEIVYFSPLPCISSEGDATEETPEETPEPVANKLDLTPNLALLVEYLSTSILSPGDLHADIHPQPISSSTNTPSTNSPAPSARVLAKALKQQTRPSYANIPTMASQSGETDAEGDGTIEEERLGRYRLTGLMGLTWLLQNLPVNERTSLPESLSSLLKTATLWTCLSPLQTSTLLPESSEGDTSSCIGYEQPGVRRAGYALLAVLVEKYSAIVTQHDTLEILSRAVLGSCWVEREGSVWEVAGHSIVVFLAKHRGCWDIDAKSSAQVSGFSSEPVDAETDAEDQASEDSENDLEDDEAESDTPVADTPVATDVREQGSVSASYNAFLSFLANICPLHPHATYPLLLVIISTLPASVLPLDTDIAVANLFSHLWSPVDARVLSTHCLPGNNNLSAFQVFLQAALDSAAYLTGKAWRGEDESGKAVAAFLVKEEIATRGWTDGVLLNGGKSSQRRLGKGREGKEEVEAVMFGKVLARLGAIDSTLTDQVLTIVRRVTLETAFPEGNLSIRSLLPRILAVIEALASSAAPLPQVASATNALLSDVVRLATSESQHLSAQRSDSLAAEKERLSEIWQLLSNFMIKHSACVDEHEYNILIAQLVEDAPFLFKQLSPELVAEVYVTFATLPESGGKREAVAVALSKTLCPSSTLDRQARLRVTQTLLAQGGPKLSVAEEGWMDDAAMEAVEGALNGDKQSADIVRSLLTSSAGFLSADTAQGMLALITTSVHTLTEDILCPADASTNGAVETRLQAALEVLQAYAAQDLSVLLSSLHAQAMVAVHHLAHVIPASPATLSAKALWAELHKTSTESQQLLQKQVLDSLALLISSPACIVSPSELVRAAGLPAFGQDNLLVASDLAASLLPKQDDLANEVVAHSNASPNITLPVLDPLVPYDTEDIAPPPSQYDLAGRSKFARHAEALIALFYVDRALALRNSKLMAIALVFACIASDELAVAKASRGVFKLSVTVEYLERVIQDVAQIFSYVLSSAGDLPSTWHKATVQSLKDGSNSQGNILQGLLAELYSKVAQGRGDLYARVLRNVLAGVLRASGASQSDGEVWLAFGMSLCEKQTDVAIATLLAVKDLLLDSQAFDQAQNRLASTLTGVSLRKANSHGVAYLRLLAASAPPAGAASTFIPQQRAMFVMRHVAGWLTDESDDADDLAEELEARVAEVYTALAPIVQDIPGAHWDSIFDLIESSLEAASLADESTYGLLYQALALLTEVRDLCLTNKALRASWTGKTTHLTLVLKLFLENQPRASRSVPLEMIQEKIVDLLRGASAEIVANADYAQLSSLLRTSPLPIQRTAYGLLRDLTVRKTGQLVLDVEASVADAEDGHASKRTIELAQEVVDVVKQGKGVAWSDAASHDGAHLVILGQLLAWMTLFDHFEDASNTLRGAYLDQIRNEGLIEQGLLPLLFEMLGVSEVGAWNFPASNFAVDEFYIDLLDINELADLTPLAAHVFYRSLTSTPSIVRAFFEACKDRQLSLSLLNFTSRHFSPVIIQNEFAALKVPAAIAQLSEEGLNVKVVSGGGASGVGSAEAVASYEIDEQPMEIGIRLPSEFPLRGVEVRDLRRVGVPENKWRGWLMGVQQLITSRNGLMLEALTVFKKNVALHFDGVVECAICYSIISLTDRTLPTKPCRTCKNRFHSSCLFKWFNSSHSSSCPMCRSLF